MDSPINVTSKGPHLVSPNAMMEEAKKHMLAGREPTTYSDWMLIVNFLVVNIHRDVVKYAMPIFKAMYDMPVSDRHIQETIEFQVDKN